MTATLLDGYRGIVCDLDGVVYAGPAAIAHAVPSLAAVRAAGVQTVYATNNASRPPSQVADHLRALGILVADEDIVNASMAGAHVLADQLVAGSGVLAVGGDGVVQALTEAGLRPVRRLADLGGEPAAAVLQGYGAEVTAADLAEAAYAVQGGARWVVTNTDRTLPTDRGEAPGNGSLVAAVNFAVDGEPEVVGKPTPVMYGLAAARMGLPVEVVLAVGDRLETDIEGAVAGGMDSVLVLTGVHGWADAAAAPITRRPTYVLADLRGLFEPYVVADAPPVDGNRFAPAVLPDVAALRGALVEAWRRVDAGTWTATDASAAVAALADGAGS